MQLVDYLAELDERPKCGTKPVVMGMADDPIRICGTNSCDRLDELIAAADADTGGEKLRRTRKECGKLFLTEHQLSQHESKHEVEVASRDSRDGRHDYYHHHDTKLDDSPRAVRERLVEHLREGVERPLRIARQAYQRAQGGGYRRRRWRWECRPRGHMIRNYGRASVG